MANLDLILQHVKVSEGGLSSDPDDNASSYPSGVYDPKTKKPFHTNKGVTYRTYINYCKVNKKTPTDTEFIKMNETLWRDILRSLYVTPFNLELINSQGVAEIIFEAHWGGGGNEMELDVQRYLREKGFNIAVDGVLGPKSLQALNKFTALKTNETALIKYMTQERLNYLKGLSDWRKYAKGWTSRVLAVEKRALSFVGKSKIATTGIIITIVAIALLLKAKPEISPV